MPLSDYEKRVLIEIEAELSAEDPRWAEHMLWPQRSHRSTLRAGLRTLVVTIVRIALLLTGLVLASGNDEALAEVGYLIVVSFAAWLAGEACNGFAGRARRRG